MNRVHRLAFLGFFLMIALHHQARASVRESIHVCRENQKLPIEYLQVTLVSGDSLPPCQIEGVVVSSLGKVPHDNYLMTCFAYMKRVFYLERGQLVFFREPAPWRRNAYACPEGFVLLGCYLYEFELKASGWGAILGILAHEVGHLVQIELIWPAGTQTIHRELEADFLAGFILGFLNVDDPELIAGFLDSIFRAGDIHRDHANHHGTGPQRQESARRGYQLGQKAFLLGWRHTPADLHQTFLWYHLPEILSR